MMNNYSTLIKEIKKGPVSKDEIETRLLMEAKAIKSVKNEMTQSLIAMVIVLIAGGVCFVDTPELTLVSSIVFLGIYLFSYHPDKLFVKHLRESVMQNQSLDSDAYPQDSLNYTKLIKSDSIIREYNAKLIMMKRGPTVGEYHLLSTFNKCRKN
jgi:hypothetical protein